MNILLDPYILAVPEQVERAESYMKTLGDWMIGAYQAGDEHRYWLSGKLYDALTYAKCYPSWDALNTLEEWLPPNREYNPNTLLRAFEQQLLAPPLFDDLFYNATLYYEGDQVNIIPHAISTRLPATISQALQETLIHAAIGKELQWHPVYDNLLFATTPDGFDEAELDIDFVAQHLETNQTVPIVHAWNMVFSPQELDEIGGLLSFWVNTKVALDWACSTLNVQGALADATIDLPKFVVGHLFSASIYDLHLDDQPNSLALLFKRIILASAGIIPRFRHNKGHNPHHPLLRVKSNWDTQIVRGDGAEAWRLHIYASCRLHYWLLPDGTIELSRVCVHEDYKIE